MSIFRVEAAEQQVAVRRGREFHDKPITWCLRVADRIGHGALRPDHELRRRTRSERDFAQTRKFVEDAGRKLGVELLQLRHIRLHGGDAHRLGRRRILHAVNAERKQRDDAKHGQREIEVGAHLARACFEKQTHRSSERDRIGKRDREGYSSDTRELRDLNERPVYVQRHAETVPTETAEEPAPHPFVCGPCARRDKRDQQISPGAQELAWPDQSDVPAPKGKMHSQINGKEKREPVQKEAVVEIAERAEPAKNGREKKKKSHQHPTTKKKTEPRRR